MKKIWIIQELAIQMSQSLTGNVALIYKLPVQFYSYE